MTAVRKVSRIRRGEDDHTEGQPAAAVEARGPVRLDQLQAELAAELAVEDLALSAEGDPAAASVGAPAVIWSDDARVTAEQLSAAVKHHQPDPSWTLDVGAGRSSLEAARARVVAGEVPTPAEVATLLQHLLSE